MVLTNNKATSLSLGVTSWRKASYQRVAPLVFAHAFRLTLAFARTDICGHVAARPGRLLQVGGDEESEACPVSDRSLARRLVVVPKSKIRSI